MNQSTDRSSSNWNALQNPQFHYSDNEQGIILISPPVQDNLQARSTWSRSGDLEIIDLTVDDDVASSSCEDSDDQIRKLLQKGYDIEPLLQKLDCPVCLNSFLSLIKQGNKLMSTLCGHVFCQSCLHNSIKANRKCPTCRQGLNLNSSSKVYVHRIHLPLSLKTSRDS